MGPAVTLAGPNITIGAELGQTRGGNLFHSFQRFDVDTGGRVTFTGPGGIRNVIGRVTGGQRSSIDGTLASDIQGADLYLLNPAGILFGPNARLDVKGSFHASTADQLNFADGAVFSALDTAGSTLTVAEPQSFGFLGANVGRDAGTSAAGTAGSSLGPRSASARARIANSRAARAGSRPGIFIAAAAHRAARRRLFDAAPRRWRATATSVLTRPTRGAPSSARHRTGRRAFVSRQAILTSTAARCFC